MARWKPSSLEQLRERYGFERLDIVKLDIEGAEAELFKAGNTEWMEKVDVVILEVSDGENPGGLQRLLQVFPGVVDCTVAGENVIAVRRGCGLVAEAYRCLR